MVVMSFVAIIGSINWRSPVDLRAVLEDIEQVVVGEFGPAVVV
jgi:hypothetical protein